MESIFTFSIIQSALELGCIYSLVTLALFLSFSILNIADLSTDGCFTLGCAVAAMVTMAASVPRVSGRHGSRGLLRICDGIFADEDGRTVYPCRNHCQYGVIYRKYRSYGFFFQCKSVWLRYGIQSCQRRIGGGLVR